MAFQVATLQGLTEWVVEDFGDGSDGVPVPGLIDAPFGLGSYSRSVATSGDAAVAFSTVAIDGYSAHMTTASGSASIEFDIQCNGTEAGLSFWLYLMLLPTNRSITISPSGLAGGASRWEVVDGDWYMVDPATSASTHVYLAENSFAGIFVGLDGNWELRQTAVPYPGTRRAFGTGATLAKSPLNRYTVRVEATGGPLDSFLDRVSAWSTPVQPKPAVRMFPRDDGRGMSSAPRIWPAPKSQRVIGGHQ